MADMIMHQQGDLLFIKMADSEAVPDTAAPAERKAGRLEVMLGETTGHAHAVIEKDVVGFKEVPTDVHISWLDVPTVATVVHEEHNPTPLTTGTWKVVRQQQMVQRQRQYVYD